MIDPLAVDEDALAQRRVALAAGRGDGVAMMVAIGRRDLERVSTPSMPMMTGRGDEGRAVMVTMGRGDRGRDGVMMTAVMMRRRSGGGATVMAPVSNRRRRRRLRVMTMVAVVDRRSGSGGRGVMMMVVVCHRGRVRASCQNGGGEGQCGDDWA